MLVIAGGIILGFIGLGLISQPGFWPGAWVLLKVAFYLGGALAAAFAFAIGQREAALGIGVVLVVIASIGEVQSKPAQPSYPGPTPEQPPPAPQPIYAPQPIARPDIRDVLRAEASADDAARADVLAVRRRLVNVGLTVAIRAATSGRSYADELEAMSQRDEAEAGAEVQRVKLALYAADIFRDVTWPKARALILEVPLETFEAGLVAWHDLRFGVYSQRAPGFIPALVD